MTLFWTITAGLLVLAMAFIVIPLLRKRDYATLSSDELNLSVFNQQLEELDNDLAAGNLDQAQYDAAKRDLERELLDDISGDQAKHTEASSDSGRWMAGLALVLPLLALLLYQALGDPQIIQQLASNPSGGQGGMAAHGAGKGTEGLPPMDVLVKKLAAKMERQPDNLEGWIMLGRSYMALKQPQKAIEAYQHAMKLAPEKPSLLLDYAEVLAKNAGNNFTGQAAPLIEKAYGLDKKNPNAIWMMGVIAYQRQQYRPAIDYWESLRDLLAPQSQEMASVDTAIGDARKHLGLPAEELPSIVQTANRAPASKAAGQAKAKTGQASSIQVQISLSPEMRDKAKPDDMVFIYAKALSGPPMPLAALRKKVQDLPLTVTLDDSMAMMPQLKLSSFPKVVVGARVSQSGNPIARPGDLEGEVRPVSPGQAEPVQVTIDSVHQ